MTKIVDYGNDSLLFKEGTAPATPSTGTVRLYAKTSGGLYSKDDTGTETALGGGGGGGSGDVVGPSSAVDGHLAVFDGTTGKLLKDGGAIPSGTGLGSTVTALSISSGVVNIDCSLGDYFTLALTANVTSLTFSSLPSSGTGRTLSVQIKQDGTGARTLALPSSFKAVSGSDTAIQAAANAVTKLAIETVDAGTTWAYVMKGRA